MDVYKNYESKFSILLQVVWVGYGFVAGGVLLLLLATCMFPKWRKKYQNQLFIHFTVARHLNNLLSMIVVKDYARDDYDSFHSYEPINFLVCIMMPTAQVAASLWTLIFTKHLYDTFVVVIYVKEEHKMLKQVFFLVWMTITPLVLCITATSVTIAAICPSTLPWPQFNLWYSITMKWPLVFANFVLYCKVVYCVLKTYNNTNRRNNKAIRTVAVFAVLFAAMALPSLMDEMRPSVLNAVSYDGDLITKFYVNKGNWVLANSALIAISYVGCFLSTVYWLWGHAADRQMWNSFIRKKFCRL
ncbi:hypothetical protein EVAR_28741_1 [Eumeta japonica]|uniref:Uncharacterized protein n=1 Tax=Eumeta variegata TaxID=151549 RepID=A0A4C1Z353_EUMVA|nr:hypothetical protein EVAR_28741_1 [Eumeta japonica]